MVRTHEWYIHIRRSTLDDISSLLVEWKRATGNGSACSRKGAGPTATQSARRSSFGGSRDTNYSLELDDRDTSSRARDYHRRVSANASTLTDGVGVLNAMKKVASYSSRASVGRVRTARSPPCATDISARISGVPSLALAKTPANDFDELPTHYDRHKFQAQLVWSRERAQPVSARAPRKDISLRLQRPASARVGSNRTSAGDALTASSRVPYTPPYTLRPSTEATQRPHSAFARTVLPGHEVLSVCTWQDAHAFFPALRVAVPTDAVYAMHGDHLRWLSCATCGELADAICRRPHQELLLHAKRLLDHLQVLTFVSEQVQGESVRLTGREGGEE